MGTRERMKLINYVAGVVNSDGKGGSRRLRTKLMQRRGAPPGFLMIWGKTMDKRFIFHQGLVILRVTLVL